MFRNMPIILIAIIISVVLLDGVMPIEIKSIVYSISLSIKTVIIFLLPIIIFGLLFKTMVKLSKDSTKTILLILAILCISNFISTIISRYIGKWVFHFDHNITSQVSIKELLPLWELNLPKLIGNDHALALGLILGIILPYIKLDLANKFSLFMQKIVNRVLKLFSYLIPIFVLGFIIKLQSDGLIKIIVQEYFLIFIITAAAQASYIFMIYFIVNNYNYRDFYESVKNMIPAGFAGFCTMSSAASMPLTIIGTEKNTDNSNLAHSVIPTTVNVHLVGDCFAIPIFAYAVLKNYGIEEPTLLAYLIFAGYFVLAKFSVAAIPGGGIIVMLPILENYLGLKGEMLSLITTLYILFDPIVTCANVFGNGAFAMVINKLQILPKEAEKL